MKRSSWMMVLVLAGVSLGGCTHWDTNRKLVSEKEIERRSVGSAYIQDRSSTAAALGGSSMKSSDRYRTQTDVAGDFESNTVREIRCVEPFEVTYDRTYTQDAELSGRWLDLTAGGIWGALGALTLAAGVTNTEPDFDGERRQIHEPHGGMIAMGGIMLGASAFHFAYTFIVGGDEPEVGQELRRAETETQLVTVDTCEHLNGTRAAR